MWLSVIVVLAFIGGAHSQCTSDSERASNAVELKFYRAQVSDWSAVDSQSVAVQLIAEANSYCANNAEECGLSSCCTNEFKDALVISQTGYPIDSMKDMLLKIALDLPENSTITGTPECVVPRSVLQTLFGNVREEIHDSTGFWITYIDDIFYGIPPPTELNQIIIPIACAVIIILAILTIVLSIWNKKKEESLRRKKIIEQRKAKSQKATPVYDVDKKDPKAPSGVTGENKAEKPKRKDQLYKDGLRKASAKKTASIASEDSAIKVDSDVRHRQAFSYEKDRDEAAYGFTESKSGSHGFSPEGPPVSHLKPIGASEEDTERTQEKKKKKKKKRSKSKEHMETPNEAFSADD